MRERQRPHYPIPSSFTRDVSVNPSPYLLQIITSGAAKRPVPRTLPGGRDPCQDSAPGRFRAERRWPLLRTFTELALVYLRPPPRPMHSWLDDRGRRLRGFGKHRVRGLTAARPPLGRYGLWRRRRRDAQSADEVHSLMAWRTWPRTMCAAGSMTPGAARTIRVAGAPWAADCLRSSLGHA